MNNKEMAERYIIYSVKHNGYYDYDGRIVNSISMAEEFDRISDAINTIEECYDYDCQIHKINVSYEVIEKLDRKITYE